MIVLPVTYKLISTVTVSTATSATFEFTSIPATFDDLAIKLSSKTNNASDYDYMVIRFNGSTSSLSARFLYAVPPSTVASSAPTNIQFATNANNLTSVFSNSELYIPNYAGNTNKSVSIDSVSEGNVASTTLGITAGLWSNTAAITSISFHPINGTAFNQYSSASLYGIKKS